MKKTKHSTKLPKRCECGGKLIYDCAFGRVFCYCAKCTPAVSVVVPKYSNEIKSGNIPK